MLSLLLATTASGNPEPSPQTRSPQTRDGKLSSVRLIEVASANRDRPWPELDGAPDGLRVVFLIRKKPGVQGKFTLRELRDFTIDGRSYRDLTRETLGKEYEPSTLIDDVPGFIENHPDLSAEIPALSGEEALIMEATIGGARFPRAGRCEVTVEVGWTSTERFSFSLDLKKTLRPAPKVPA
jgi:hypothetical protein